MKAGWSFSIQLKRWLSNAINVTYVTAYNYWNTIEILWCCNTLGLLSPNMPPEQWSDFPSTASFVQDVLAWTTALYTVTAQVVITLVAVGKSGRHTYLGVAARQFSWVTTNWDFFAYFWKIYKIIISDIDLHNLRLFGSALESSTSHRSIYYFKICNLHKLFEKPTKI